MRTANDNLEPKNLDLEPREPDPVPIDRSAALQKKIPKLRCIVPIFFRIQG